MASFHYVNMVLAFVTEFGIEFETNEAFLFHGGAVVEELRLFHPLIGKAIVLCDRLKSFFCA